MLGLVEPVDDTALLETVDLLFTEETELATEFELAAAEDEEEDDAVDDEAGVDEVHSGFRFVELPV